LTPFPENRRMRLLLVWLVNALALLPQKRN
jgi:hypothetical protein